MIQSVLEDLKLLVEVVRVNPYQALQSTWAIFSIVILITSKVMKETEKISKINCWVPNNLPGNKMLNQVNLYDFILKKESVFLFERDYYMKRNVSRV